MPHGQESERCEGYFEIGDLGIQEQEGGGGVFCFMVYFREVVFRGERF